MKKQLSQTKEQIIEAISIAKQEREALFKKKEPIDHKLVKNYKLIEQLNDELSKIEVVEPKTTKEKIDYFLFADGQVSGVRYKEREKFWHEFCGDFGLIQSGYYADTKQVALSIKLTYGSEKSLKNHIEQITELLPHIKAHEDGYKYFDVFEHTLSRFCSYKLFINEEDKKYIVSAGSWTNNKFTSLKTALEYIQTNHWYDGNEEESDCDDDN